MKLKHLVSMMACSLFVAGSVYADDVDPPVPPTAGANQGAGKVIFNGSIIDAPCSIKPESELQAVAMGSIANALLDAGKASPKRAFSIDLEACTLATKKTVTVTFAGQQDGQLLALSGSAAGAGIAIENNVGKSITLGQASPAINLLNGDNSLQFLASLKSTGKTEDDKVTPGQFSATANFVLNYL